MLNIKDLFDLKNTEHEELFKGIKYPWEVLPKIEDYLKEKLKNQIHGKTVGQPYVEDNVFIGEGTVIEPGVMIKGPAIIGKNCQIRHGSYLRGRVIIGDDVIVGNSSELKNSLLFNKVQVPHFSYVGDSILGYKTHLGAGVVLSNVKIPTSEIKVTTLEKVYKTGLKKFGAIIGDNCEIGCNSVLNPGSIIGKSCLLYPLISWRGVLGPNSIVKLRQNHETVAKR